jgi:hypothetical protein
MSASAFEITLRGPAGNPDGVELLSAVQIVSGYFDPPPGKLVLFIHGFNDTREFAESAYQEFLENSGISDGALSGQPCFLHWPSNRNWGILSPACYVVDPPIAVKAGQLLYAFLKQRVMPGPEPLHVTIISHSLGVRVALEALAQAAADGDPRKPRFDALCTMAAAVCVSAVESGGNLLPAVQSSQKSTVLFSGDDMALDLGFPVGETVAGEGFFPTAVGHAGEPSTLWTNRSDMGVFSYGHSDYWPGKESASSVARFLGLPTPKPPVAQTMASRELPPPHSIPSKSLPVRELA